MISFPWDNTSSTNLDRNVSSDTLAEKYFHAIAGANSGIYAPVGAQGSVSAGTGMTVVVQPVAGVIIGRIFAEADVRTLTIQASESLDRIDTVVIRRDKAGRACDLYIVKGTAATTPVRPALTRSGDVYEVGIADLFIAKNTTSITNERITDTRSETARCQIIPVVGSIDTTSMFNQYQAALDAYLDIVAAALDETLAGNLQNQINVIDGILDKFRLNQAPIYSASSTYALGDYVMYDNYFYKCTTAITVAEAWNAAHWTQTSIGAELDQLNTNLTAVEGTLAIGATSITLTDARLTATSNIIPMTSIWGVNPLTITKNVGNVVMTFPAQTVAVTVGVEIHG